jgi:hypothetical protein
MPRERTPQSELERELDRQNQLFQNACDTLAALGDGVRLSIPEQVLDELDAAFNAPRVSTVTRASTYPLVRV